MPLHLSESSDVDTPAHGCAHSNEGAAGQSCVDVVHHFCQVTHISPNSTTLESVRKQGEEIIRNVIQAIISTCHCVYNTYENYIRLVCETSVV